MSDDLERVERALARQVAPQVREGVMERRQGVIDAVNANGTVDVTVGGVLIPGMRYKAWYSPVVADVVFVEVVDTDFVVDGNLGQGVPTCRVNRSSEGTHTSNSTWQAVPFNAEDFDPTGMHDTATNPSRITIAVPGVYALGGVIGSSGNSTGVRQIGLRVNGTGTENPTYSGTRDIPGADGESIVHYSDLVKLAAGDWVELVYYQNSGGNLSLNGGLEGRAGFWAAWVGRG